MDLSAFFVILNLGTFAWLITRPKSGTSFGGSEGQRMGPVPLLFLMVAAGEGPAPEWQIGVAARARQERVRTLDVRFRIEVFEEGRESPLANTDGNRLVLDGDRLAVDLTESALDGTVTRVTRLTYDGHTVRYRYLHPVGTGRGGAGGGVLATGGTPAKQPTGAIHPLLFAVRGIDARFTLLPLDEQTWTAARAYPQVFGETLLCSEMRGGPGKNPFSLVFSPAKDHSVVAYGGDGMLVDICVEWEPTVKVWLPKSWVTSRVKVQEQGASRFQRYTVTSVAINQPIPADAFDFQFPPGIQVTDLGSQQSFVVGPSGELTPTRPAAPTSIPQESVPRQPTGSGLLIVGAAFGGLVALLLALRFRSRGERRTGPSGSRNA